MSMYTIL